MCKSCAEGGVRCQSDTSVKRRLRRKTSQTLTTVAAPVKPNKSFNTVPSLVSSDLVNEVASIHSSLLAPTVSQSEQDIIDSHIEQKVTAVGAEIAKKVDELVEPLKQQYKKDYDAPNDELDAAMAVYEDAFVAEADLAPDASEEEKKAVAEQVEKAEALFKEASDLDDVRRSAITNEYLSKVANTYVTVLSDFRPIGGKVNNATRDSDANAVALLEDSVEKVYPSEWIDNSNASGPLHFESTNGRAGFVSNLVDFSDEAIKQYPDEVTMEAPGLVSTHIPSDKAEEVAAKIGHGAYVADARELDINNEMVRIVIIPAREIFDPSVDATNDDGTPAGEGWELSHFYDFNTATATETPVWNKSLAQPAVKRSTISLPKINEDKTQLDAQATAIHEYAHRMEETRPHIMRMEEAWLKRRTTDPVTGIREDNSIMYPVLPGTSVGDLELGRRDNFLHHYIGKEYTTSHHREVFSVGMESMFGHQKLGGLIGASDNIKADQDHRNFILGLLATA